MGGEIARVCDTRGCYTNLNLDRGVALSAAGACPLHYVDFDEKNHAWTMAVRPGDFRHLTLEEDAAAIWSLHDRLRRPAD